eukprot:5044473-Amphidinium_carterae.1
MYRDGWCCTSLQAFGCSYHTLGRMPGKVPGRCKGGEGKQWRERGRGGRGRGEDIAVKRNFVVGVGLVMVVVQPHLCTCMDLWDTVSHVGKKTTNNQTSSSIQI